MQLVDALVETLMRWNVGRVFGVSGANIEHLHDAMVRLGGTALQGVLAKSEIGAAFMADGRARVHNTLGVCCATSGGGMMNLAVGLAESHASGVPVLALIGQIPQSLEGHGGFQDSSGLGNSVDALGLCRSISRYAEKVTDPAAFWPVLRAAAEAALGGGPACVLLPRDMYSAPVPPRPADFPLDLASLRTPAPCSLADLDALDSALRTARCPVLLLGRHHENAEELSSVAGIPVATTMANVAAFPNTDPRYMGCVGGAGHPSAHAHVNERADVVVLVDCAASAMERMPISDGLARARVFVVGSTGTWMGRVLPHARRVRGDSAAVLHALSERCQRKPYHHGHVPPLRRYVPQRVEPTAPMDVDGLLQSEALDVLETWLPAGHVVYDAGNCAAAALHHVRLPRHSTSTIALGMGGMGYGIAAAVGIALDAAPGTRTTVFCGDGALLMQGYEIHTAAELQLPILFVVFNNGAHGMCVTRQHLYFTGRVACSTYERVDCAALARGLAPASKLWTGRARTVDELRRALNDYTGHGPGVLELVLAQEEVPPFAPFLSVSAPTYVVDKIQDAHHAA